MNWVRANYDRAVLIAALLVLLLCAIFILRNAIGFGTTYAVMPPATSRKSAAPSAQALELDAGMKKLQQPSQWVFGGRSGLFVPEKHFIGANGQPATLQTTMVHPPVPNEWLEQFGLSIQDADVLDQDPDGDGFNNLDEWQGHTNPTDPNSHPDYPSKLKLKSSGQEPFRLVFSSWVGDTFAINTIDLKQPTQFLKIGDTVAGTQFKIVKFNEKYETNQYGTKMDASELTLENLANHEQLTLTKEKVATSPESVAKLVYLWGGRQEFEVRKDQEFSLKPQMQIKYKLVEVDSAKAVIVNTQKPNERIEIGLLGP